jgi:periplasmic divalent cation tolerance protein
MSASGLVTLYVTCPDNTHAEQIAKTLVQERLAACANVLPGITSFYFWEGQLEQETEVALLLKSTASLAELAIARIKALHPAQIPAITVWPIETGFAPYLQWVKGNTR